jgi:hypothetical protein
MFREGSLRRSRAAGSFVWPLAQWELFAVDGKGEDVAFRLVDPGSPVRRWWAPMKKAPALYREAAAIDLKDPKAILDWVNRRGMLWWPTEARARLPVSAAIVVFGGQSVVRPFNLSPEGWPYVRVSKVQAALRRLGQAVALLDGLRARKALPRDVSLLPVPAELWQRAKALAPRLKVPQDYLLAWAALQEAVISHLRLTATFSRVPLGARRLLVKREGERALLRAPGLEVHFMPTSLESCLWWQFFQDAFGGRPARVCPGCGEVFFPRRSNQQWHRKCYRRAYMQRWHPGRTSTSGPQLGMSRTTPGGEE